MNDIKQLCDFIREISFSISEGYLCVNNKEKM